MKCNNEPGWQQKPLVEFGDPCTSGRKIMSRIKDEAIALIQSLPDDCSLEEIHYHLYVRAKVERGIRAVDEGRTVPQEEVERQVREWARSSGRTQP